VVVDVCQSAKINERKVNLPSGEINEKKENILSDEINERSRAVKMLKATCKKKKG
jgi:hypothetical protein